MSTSPLQLHLPANNRFPNSPFPLTIYCNFFPRDSTPEHIESTFASNGWQPQWRYPMYKTAHYHSNTHETLGVYSGAALLRFGGDVSPQEENGPDKDEVKEVRVSAGDVIVIPAGVSHMSTGEEEGEFMMVGAYPKGAPQWDMQYAKKEGEDGKVQEERVKMLKKVDVPESDPVHGKGKGICELWVDALDKGGRGKEVA